MKTFSRIDYKDSDENVHVNDIQVNNAGTSFAIDEKEYAVANIVESRVKTLMDEMRLHQGIGIPYFDTVFKDKNLVSDWAYYVRKEVLEVDGVSVIESFDYKVNDDKTLSYSIVIRTDYGTEVTVNG